MSDGQQRPPVVVLHGLGRTRASMAGMRRFLEKSGFSTWSRTYPSRSRPLPELAALVASWIREDLGPDARPLAVTHSLGGVLVRMMSPHLPFSRVVMLAPPNRGSRLAADLAELGLFKKVFGPVGGEIAAAPEWPLLTCPTAVIAGTLAPSIGNPISWLTSSIRTFDPNVAHDGTVSVDETRLQDMALFREVPASHTWIMNHPQARATTLRFLRDLPENSAENEA